MVGSQLNSPSTTEYEIWGVASVIVATCQQETKSNYRFFIEWVSYVLNLTTSGLNKAAFN